MPKPSNYKTKLFPFFLLNTKTAVSVLWLLFFLLPQAFAQQAQSFENAIKLEDAGVGYVSDAVIDKNGFLWIAGSNGLTRYDGSHFEMFKHDPEDSLSLLANYIHDLFYDEEYNRIFVSSWSTSNSGISILDLETEQFKNIRFDSTNSNGLEGHNLYWTCRDKFGSYWISIKNQGLIKYLPEQDSIIQYPYQPSLNQTDLELGRANTFQSYSFDIFNDSLLWLGAAEGSLFKFNVINHQYTRYPLGDRRDISFRKILHHSDNKVFIGTWTHGFYSFDPKNNQFIKHEFEGISFDPQNYMDQNLAIKVRSKDCLYITNKAGLIEYDVKQNKVIDFKKNDFTKGELYGFFETDKKNRVLYWNNWSFYIFDPLRQQNKFYSYGIKAPSFNFLVRRILEDEKTGKLWVAAQFSEGLYRLDLKTKEWEVFPSPNSYFKDRVDFPGWDVLKTKAGEILVLAADKGIYKVLEKDKRLVPWELQLNNTKYRRMMEDSQGNIWVTTYHDGVFRIDPKTKNIRHFKKEFIHPDLKSIGSATDIKEDRNGNIWIRGTGFKVYNPQLDTVYLFPYFFPDQKIVYDITSFGIDGEGNVLTAIKEGGYIGITDADHPEKGIVEYFDKSKGLIMRVPNNFLLDKNKNIWLLGDGLEKINADRSATQFYRSFYFSNTESITFTQLSDGSFATGDRQGINIINPDSLKVNQELFQPYIHSFKVFDKGLNLESSPFQKAEVYLKPGENFFSLEFSALNPVFFGGSKFKYQLEGVDPEWIDPQSRRYVAYTNINSGSYDFRIKASNNEGVWNEKPTVLRIHIATPWYKTWWFYSLLILLFSIAFYYWYLIRINRRKEKEEALRLKELDTFKTRFYSNITHEFRTPLTIIQGMANELEEHPEQEPKRKINLIKKNSRNLLALVNQMLDLSKLQAGKAIPDLKQDDIIGFISYLVESHESYAKLQNLGLQFYSEEKELVMDFDAKKLEQILANLFSNAIKFTPEYGKILIVAKKITTGGISYIEIKVKDNGIGISKENLPHIFDRFHQVNPIYNNQGSGIGLALVKELIGIMNGTIRVESILNEGSTFFITLPIQNKSPLVKEADQHVFKSLPVINSPKKQGPVLSENGLPILLIIEDNTDVTYYLETCLKGHYQTLSRSNGKAGVETALEILPDVIISDVMMPEMDGFEVCKILKEDERSSHIPIILLTAKATKEDKIEGLTQGADAYLTKPFEKEELMIRLDKLMEIRKTLQKKYSNSLISSQSDNKVIESKEDSFIGKIEKIILANLEDDDFSINELSRELHLSRSQVHRKIKALTGMSTAIYMRSVRLQKAKELLQSNELSISEVAYQCGFKSPVYFSQVFKETFGFSPSATRK
jgi:signal transduction histidine kinase/DNA-binding response OmpR family regulator/ligand-binding sensor domain-containing protein